MLSLLIIISETRSCIEKLLPIPIIFRELNNNPEYVFYAEELYSEMSSDSLYKTKLKHILYTQKGYSRAREFEVNNKHLKY